MASISDCRRHGERGHRVDAAGGEPPFRSEQRGDLANGAPHRRAEPAFHCPMWQVTQCPSEPPPKSRQYTWTSCGVWVMASAVTSDRTAVDLPLCGFPTKAT